MKKPNDKMIRLFYFCRNKCKHAHICLYKIYLNFKKIKGNVTQIYLSLTSLNCGPLGQIRCTDIKFSERI